MAWFPGDEKAAKDLAARMTQIISNDDLATVGQRILKAVEEAKPSAAVMAVAMLRYRENTTITYPEHMAIAQQMMRVPLDILLAKEQAESQSKVANLSIFIAALSLITALASLYVSFKALH